MPIDPVAMRPADRVREIAFIAAAVAGLYLCYRLALPFLSALTWALAIAILLMPIHRALEPRLKPRGLAATASVLVVALIIVVPATIMVGRLVDEAGKGAVLIKAKIDSGTWRRAIDSHPKLAPAAEWLEQRLDLPQLAAGGASWLADISSKFVGESLVQAIVAVLTFYLLFYFLRDRREMLGFIQELSPLSDSEMALLLSRIVDTVHATLYGTIAVAAVQGLWGGLMFWWLDLPAPMLWGLVMGLLAVVPTFGAFLVWIPAAIYLALVGNWGQAVILTAWGTVVIGGIDNVLYPVLVGNRLKMHSTVAFISVVGGLVLFGASGLILGPLTVAMTALLLEIWRGRRSAGMV